MQVNNSWLVFIDRGRVSPKIERNALDTLLDGLIIKEQSGFFWVEVADGKVYMCRLRGRLLEEAQSSDLVAIGDQVKISILDSGQIVFNWLIMDYCI